MSDEGRAGWYLFPRRAAVGTAPSITSANTKTIAAGGTPVETVTATGTYPIAYSIIGGANAASFTVDPYNGNLSFVNAATAGSYSVTVEATNSFGQDTQAVTVTVSGGGGAYTAEAVHIDDATFLKIDSLTAADSPYLTFALFFRCTPAWINVASSFALIDFYPAGDEDIIGFNPAVMAAKFSASFDDNPGNGQSFAYDATGTPTPSVFDSSWHSLVVSMDFNHDGNAKLGAAYLDRVLQAPGGSSGHDDKPAFSFKFSGAPVGVPDTTEDYPVLPEMDLSVYQLFVGTKIVQDDNTILTADLNNFVTVDNKPVNPATAALAYGSPTILFAGDHTGFATNQGTGGAFTLTGALTNATTSPSD